MIEKTLAALTTDVQKEIYQVAGMSVQVYSQDNIQQKLQNAFETFFDDTTVKWKKFFTDVTYTLDGSTGRTTVPIKNTFKNFEDITNVFPGVSTRPLSMWNMGNPNAVVGSYPKFYRPDTVDVLKIVPALSTGQITVAGKVRPTYPFTINDVLPFDYLSLTYFAAWQYMVDDGANMASSEKLRQLFENRYKQMRLQQSNEPISLSGNASNIPTTWFSDDM